MHNFFCPNCMTWLVATIEGVDAHINVGPTLCDDSSRLKPFVETMTKEKLHCAKTSALHSFDAVPSFDEFQRLQAEFAGPE